MPNGTYKPYPRYKDSGVEWLGDVPEEWRICECKFAYDIQLGKMLQPIATNPLDVPVKYLKAIHVQWEHVDVDEYPEMWATPEDIEKYGVVDGDLLTCEGGEVGRSAIAEAIDTPCIIQNALHRIRPKSNNNVQYLAQVLRHAASQDWFSILCNKATIAHLTSEKLGRLMIPLPPLPEQAAIAAFLDRETARLDALVARKRRLIELLQEKRAAVISHAVTRGLDPAAPMKDSGVDWLGEVPAHWEVKRLKLLIDDIQIGPFGGMLKELADEDTGFKLYGQENIISGDFNKGFRWLKDENYHELIHYNSMPGDILLTRKGSLGHARIFPENSQNGIIDSDTIRVRVNKKHILADYLLLALRDASYIKDQIDISRRGAILSGINTAVVSNLLVAAPPPAEQTQILESVLFTNTRIDALITKINTAITTLQEYRTALITAAVTGKIDVRGRS